MNINVKLRKQMMSILLCFALLMSYIPLSAFAAEEQANITVTCGEQTAEYNDLKEALANEWVINSTADVPATLTLNNDISIEGSFYINGGNVILDLNGNKIVGASGTSEYLFEITAGTVTVKGSDSISNVGRGVFKIWGYSSLALYDCEVISEEADSTILNIGTFNLYNASIVSDSIGVHSEETFNFYGGSIISEGIGIENTGELSLFSGSITSKQYGVENEINRTVNIDGIVDISGGFGDFLINLRSTLNINCDLGETVYSFALVKSNEDYNGAFAVPGDGITLNKDCFQLSHPYYLYEKDGDSTLYISECDHTTGTLDNEYRCSICGHIPEYETYVDGVAVTLANQDDVLGDGTVKFVPAANEGEADILYLNGVNISVSENNIFQGVATVGIYSENALIIDVSGNNCIAITPDIENSVGVVSEKNLTFQGEGVLNVTVADGLVAVGIVSNTGDITIDTDVSVNIDCVEPEADSEKMICNLIALGDVINNGSLKFTGENKTVSIEGTATCGENAKHPYDDESKCVLCGETCNHSENTNSVYTSNGKDTHSLICSICGNAVNGNESHIVAYKSNDSEGVITAYCSVCGETLGTVSVEVNDKTYDGTKAEAILTKTGSLENAKVTVEWEYEGGLVSSEAPSNAGSYKVSIRIGSAIATDSFTIARVAMTGISVNGYSGEYDGDAHSISISNVPSDATVKYSISENGTYTITKPTYTEKGTYEVWYKIEKENYETVSGSASVVILQATNSWTSEPSINGWIYGETPDNPNSAAEYGEVKVEYRLASEIDEDYTTAVPTEAGNYLVRFSVAGTENYTSLSKVVGMEVAKVKLTVTADDKSKTYGESDPELTYQITEGQLVGSDTLEDISICRADGEDADNYAITVSQTEDANPNYDITFNGGTFTINQKEVDISWEATMFLPYTGNSLVPKANVTNLVDGDECVLTTEVVETDEGAGIIPGTWTAEVTALSNDNYKLPESGERVTATFEVVNGYQNYAPNGVEGVNETIDGKADGKIIGVDSTMEYRKADETDYTAISGTEITDLADGIYYVRYAAKTYYNASPAKEVVIGIGNKLTVTVPTTQTGYEITSKDSELVWNGSTTLTFALADGYSKTDAFAVKINGNEVELDENGQYAITNVQENITVTVEGVADITAPTAEIRLGTNKWNTFLNNITFGLFFKNTQSVTITAGDVNTGSGLDMIYYYLSSEELTEDSIKAIVDWKAYSGVFSINPNNEYIIYVKAVDKAGNTTYISSDGLVLDAIAPVITGVEDNGTYYGSTAFGVNENYIDTITVDGNVVDLTNGKYTISADGNEHTIVVTDKAGNISSTVKIIVMAITSIDDAIENIKTTNVKSTDRENIQEVLDLVNSLIDSGEDFTDEEEEQLSEIKSNAESLLKQVSDIESEVKDLTDKVGAYEEAKVTSDDKQTIIDLLSDIDVLLNGDNLTEAEKNTLGEVKADAEALIKKIDDAAAADDTNNTEKVKDITSDNVTTDDKADLEKAKDDLEKALEDYKDNLTEDEKKAIEDEIDRIEDALKIIEKVEDVENKISNLPDTITKIDAETIKEAENAYNALSDYEKSIVDEDSKKKLDDAITALENLDKPATSPNTGDDTNIWMWCAVLFVSGMGLLGTIAYDRKKKKIK